MRKLLLLLSGSLLCMQLTYAQNRALSGTVTDERGNPLPNVSIQVKGAKAGTVSNADGTFTLNVPSGSRTLVFSSVGQASKEVSVGDNSTFRVSLESAQRSLDEVVVVGYGTQRKREATGNIATIKGGDLANKPVQSFDQSLGGRAAGVQVTIPSGVLNAPPVIRIRGTNSISLSSYPLIVIDGVPTFTGDFSGTSAASNALSSINPNDIESIDIAKDAAATAIYGSRAANGVVFITTKKGKTGRAKVSVDSWVGVSQVQRLPELLNAAQYTDYKNEALRNAGTFSATNQFALTNGPDGKPIDTRWYDYIYRTGLQHSNTVNIAGASDATSYYFSGGYTSQQGIINRNDFKRMNFLANVDHKVGSFLTLGGKVQYSSEGNYSAASSGSLGDAFATAGLGRVPLITAPNVSPLNNDGSYNYSGALIGVMGNKVGQVGFNNPLIALDLNRGNTMTQRMLTNAFVQLKPFEWMTLRSAFGIDNIWNDNESYSSPISGEGFSSNGSATSYFAKNKAEVWTNTLQLRHTFLGKHNADLLAGVEEQKNNGSSYGLNRTNVSDPNFRDIQGGWATPNNAGLGIGESYLISNFGRLQYNYDNKYFLSGNLRRDGASQLGTNSKYGTFWGASAGWEITREQFWNGLGLDRIFSSFKLRGSYGKVGNIGGLGNFASLSTFGSGLYGGNGTVVFSQAGNQNLTWETSKKTDIGINYGFLNDRITGSMTYYRSDINGLLLFVPQPPSAGLPSTIPQNIGGMYNKGLEFDISAAVIRKKKLTWNTSFNISYNKNEVTSLAPGINSVVGVTGGLESPSITVVGQPIGMLNVTRTGGVDAATGRRIFLNKAGTPVYFQHVAPAGQFRFSYADGTVAPAVSSADAVVYRNTNPKFFGGFDNTVRYGNFELNTLFTFQAGNYIYFGTNAGLRDQRFWNNSTDVLNRWQKAGDVTDIPKPIFGDNISNGSSFPLDINVFKGDFVKLRTLTLSYSLPGNVAKIAKLSGARFYVSGNNLLILTKYPGPDPEVSSNGNGTTNFGIDRNTVANQRNVTFGVNLSL